MSFYAVKCSYIFNVFVIARLPYISIISAPYIFGTGLAILPCQDAM